MNCKGVNNTIEALTLANITTYLEGGNDDNSELKTHIETCTQCKKTLHEHHAYLNKMSNIHTPEFSKNDAKVMLSKFSHTADNNAVNVNIHNKPAKNDSSFFQGFIAASVLALSVFGAWNVFTNTVVPAPLVVQNNITVPEYITTEVVLVINAPEDMFDADLNIVLPQQVALEGYDDLQELNWAVDLKAGANTLSLPIRVNKHHAINQPLSIMAKLYHYAEEREFEIKIDVEKIQSEQKNSAYLNLVPKNNITRV